MFDEPSAVVDAIHLQRKLPSGWTRVSVVCDGHTPSSRTIIHETSIRLAADPPHRKSVCGSVFETYKAAAWRSVPIVNLYGNGGIGAIFVDPTERFAAVISFAANGCEGNRFTCVTVYDVGSWALGYDEPASDRMVALGQRDLAIGLARQGVMVSRDTMTYRPSR